MTSEWSPQGDRSGERRLRWKIRDARKGESEHSVISTFRVVVKLKRREYNQRLTRHWLRHTVIGSLRQSGSASRGANMMRALLSSHRSVSSLRCFCDTDWGEIKRNSYPLFLILGRTRKSRRIATGIRWCDNLYKTRKGTEASFGDALLQRTSSPP